jgi:hypothetical protein
MKSHIEQVYLKNVVDERSQELVNDVGDLGHVIEVLIDLKHSLRGTGKYAELAQ